MKKVKLPILLASLLLVGCNAGNNGEQTKATPTSIKVINEDKTIEYGTNLNELGYHVVLTYSDGSEKVLNKDEYSLSFNKNATFTVGEGKAILTYKEDTSITSEIDYVVVPRKNASILFIGNSFSDDTVEYMYYLASTLGIGLTVNNLFIGSCTLDIHYDNLRNDAAVYEYRYWNGTGWATTTNNYKISTALKQENWDFVSLQQGSGSSGIFSTYSHLSDCVDLINQDLVNPNHTQFVWNMTWAYQQDSTHGEFVNYGNNQLEMYNKIVSCVQKLDRNTFKVVIPTGTAIQNARTSSLGDTLTRDGFHLNFKEGRYIAALNAIKAVTGIDYEDVLYSPSLSEQSKKICLESVANAWANPYEVTNSIYEPVKPEDLSDLIKDMTKLDVTYTRDYYYYSIDPSNCTNPLGPWSNYICTNLFTRENIPNGSIIHIAPGYQYRPEGWLALNTYWTGVRPDNVTTEYIKVDDEWWGEFNYRGFNISLTSGSPLEGRYEEAEAAFAIYVPKK